MRGATQEQVSTRSCRTSSPRSTSCSWRFRNTSLSSKSGQRTRRRKARKLRRIRGPHNQSLAAPLL